VYNKRKEEKNSMNILITYMILTGQELYDYLVDYNAEDPWYKFEEIAKRIKYFVSNDIVPQFAPHDQEHYFFCALDNEKIVGMLKLKTGGNDSLGYPGYKNWISSCSVDPEYQGQRIASVLSDMLFNFANKQGINILTSGYTKQGFEKLKPIFARDAMKYEIDFMDDKNHPEF